MASLPLPSQDRDLNGSDLDPAGERDDSATAGNAKKNTRGQSLNATSSAYLKASFKRFDMLYSLRSMSKVEEQV